MDEKDLKSNFCQTKVVGSKGNSNNDTGENISKLKVKAKNGLVNGVRDDKLKCNNKKSKTDTKSTNNDHKCTSKIHNMKDAYIDTVNSDCTKELKNEISQTNQSKLKSVNEPFDSRKNKHKTKKSEQNDLPKFDLTSLINSTVINEKSITNITETPSTSKMNPYSPSLLDCQDNSDFEKSLIESIKNMKIQQENSFLNHSTETSEKQITLNDQMLEEVELPDVIYVQYESELQMPMIMKIIQKDLSEPYSIYTYRYFIHNWPKLCFLAMCEEKCVGAIVCKLDFHRKSTKRGYIAMLAVDKDHRKRRIGSTLVRRAITEMIAGGADEVVLETEVTNKPALRLYEQLGFVRDKRLFRYYLNGVDALRLKLWLR